MNHNSTSSPASTFSETSDSDAVNSATARVYFGPLQSPEKKFFVHDVARRRTLHPLALGSSPRRSPRLSAHPSPSPPQRGQDMPTNTVESDDDADEMDEVTAHLSRGGTPDNDPLPQDEPSSVLASRIMRAHDNPSPPPQPRNTGSSHVPATIGQFPTLDVPPSPFRSINLYERLNQLAAPVATVPPSGLAHNSQVLDRDFADISWDASQRDLISFDNTSTPTESCGAIEPTDASAAGSSTPTLPAFAMDGIPTTVDELLSQSPTHTSPIAHATGSGASDQVTHVHEQSIRTTYPQVAIDGTSATSSSNPDVPPLTDSAVPPPAPCTPVRRSPRHSGTSHSLQNNHATGSASTSVSKGKSKAIYPAAELSDGTQNGSAECEEGGRRTRESSTESDETTGVRVGRRFKKKSAKSGRPAAATTHRELGSLSPESASVLARLVPSPQHTTSTISSPSGTIVAAPENPTPSTPPRPSTSALPHPNLLHTTVQRPPIPSTPHHVTANFRNPSSPLKFSFTVEDVARTPARRVPIADAAPDGIPSAMKAAQLSIRGDHNGRLGSGRTPVFTRPMLDDPLRSPAKRIPVPEFMSSSKSLLTSSPSRSAQRARSASVEPKPIALPSARSRSVEPSPRFSRVAECKGKNSIFPKPPPSIPRSSAKLPFPLVAGQASGNDLPHSIPEENETTDVLAESSTTSNSRTVLPSSPTKSSLKQPSAGSRIPRIGAKPYARPLVTVGKVKESSTLPLVKPRTAGNAKPAVRLARSGSGSGSSSDELSAALASNGKGTAESSTSATLKRKRGTEPVASPAGTRPVMMRQVLPGMLGGKYAPKPPPTPITQGRAPAQISPQKVVGPIKMRKVVDGMLSSHYGPPSDARTKMVEEEVMHEGSSLPDKPVTDLGSAGMQPPMVPEEVSSPKRSLADGDAPMSSPGVNDEDGQDSQHSSPLQDVAQSSNETRRPLRTRKLARPVADVFGTVTRQVQPRRKPPASRTESDGFQGMSAVALKTLTNSNTTKNQRFLVRIETEVIRKDGIRPDSPTMKVRTILQKQREEKDKQRKERAERRARRSEDGLGLSDTEGFSEYGDQPLWDADVDEDENGELQRRKHRRGPGDEEDFETPEKPERPIKRPRFGDNLEEVQEKKRVKWHRGLSTTICIDDLHPKPKARPKDFVIEKGCLAPTAKNIRLDTLGNMADAESRPLTDLVQENVVVKKFVYDNDIEPEVAPAKATRSKSKKAKS